MQKTNKRESKRDESMYQYGQQARLWGKDQCYLVNIVHNLCTPRFIAYEVTVSSILIYNPSPERPLRSGERLRIFKSRTENQASAPWILEDHTN